MKRKVKQKHISVLTIVLMMLIPYTSLEAQEEKPNILFFYIDDLGWKDLGSYGSEFYETPAIDELAEQGIRFTAAYQAAARCVPSRLSLFTGKYHERAEVADSKGLALDQYTFAEAFQDAGYHTFFTGKWHLGKDSTRYPDKQGFDVNVAGCEWGAPQGSTDGGGYYYSPYDNPTLADGPDGEYITDRLTQETVDFINNHQSTQPGDPFLACVFHYAVHTPIEAPESYVAPYREKLNSMEYALPEKEIDGPAKTKLRQDHPVYAGMIASVDESVRRIREALDAHGLSENTIIVFSTDHGGLSTTLKSQGREISTSNYPLRTGKGWLYEGGIRSPLIVYWPGVTQANSSTDELVVSMDIYPSLLEMAGLPPQPGQHLDGQSFAPLLRGEDWSRTGPLMWYFPMAKVGTGNPNMAAVRVGEHKLIHYMHQDRFELYNIEKDIRESNNLAPQNPELTEQLKTILFSIESETNMPALSQSRINIEVEDILPEYPTSISQEDYPELTLLRLEEMEELSALEFKISISEENLNVHPVDLNYYYREKGKDEWIRILTLTGDQFRLLPGEYTQLWKYSGLEGKTIDIKINGAINNELYPAEVGEVEIKEIKLKKKEEEAEVLPEGRRIRDIIADKYPDGRLLIGGTTGEWAFGEPNGKVMDREFSYVTPENDFKHSVIRSTIDAWNWSKADAWLQHIVDQQQILRIHGPISPQCSKWAKNDSRTGAELELELNTFFPALCQRYNSVQNIKYIDVVNETVTVSGEWFGPREGVDDWENPWTIIGFETDIPAGYPTLDSVPLYIIRAFEIANMHAPNLKLMLNQHGAMETGMWNKIKDLILYLRNEKGFRVDALGWQAHIDTGWELEGDHLAKLNELIDWCQANDLEFHITEFDSWLRDPEQIDFEAQAETYRQLIKPLIAKSANGIIGWNTWHISDAKGWHPERLSALFDTLYNAKPAYYALQQELENGIYDTLVEVDLHAYVNNKGTILPLRNASILFNYIPGKTDESGYAAFHAPISEVSYSIDKPSVFPLNKTVVISGDSTLSDTLIVKTFDVNFTLIDKVSESPIKELEVCFGNMQQVTNNSGQVLFPEVSAENNDLSIQTPDYSYHASIEFYSDTSITIILERLTQQLNFPMRFHVYNVFDSSAISGATVTIEETAYLTDSNGDLDIDLPFGEYNYEVSKDKYASLSGSVLFLKADTLIAVPLSLLFARIKFVLSSEGSPVPGADITIDEQVETSNAIGMAYFYEMDVDKNYSYTVSKESYEELQGTIYLVQDSTVNLELEIATSLSHVGSGPVIFPNPASTHLTFQSPAPLITISFYDCTGRLVLKENRLNVKKYVQDIGALEQGIYTVEVKYEDKPAADFINLVVINP